MRAVITTILAATAIVASTTDAYAATLSSPYYDITGTNARMPFEPTPVRFDGVEETFTNANGYRMHVNESMQEIDGATWLEFSFRVDPGTGLANDFDQLWEVGVSNLQFNENVRIPFDIGNAYLYFSRQGEVLPMQLPSEQSGAHPFNDAISQVWYHPLRNFDPTSPENPLPVGTDPSQTLRLFHHYDTLGELLARLDVPADVDGFHFGVRVVPEPASGMLMLGGAALVAATGRRRRRRVAG